MTDSTTPVYFGRHMITNRNLVRGWAARSFRGTTATSDVMYGDSPEEAIQAVKSHLEATQREILALRGADGFPTVQEVKLAFTLIKISKQQDAMLTAHLKAPHQILTATELAEVAGSKSYVAANSIYGKLARKLAEEMEWTPKETGQDKQPVWTFALAIQADEQANKVSNNDPTKAHWRWQLRREIIAALS